MEPITIVTLITAVIPFATTALKKLFKTNDLPKSHGINALIPILLGILSAGVYEYQRTHDWMTALVVGLSSGGVASSARDIDKNLIGIVGFVLGLFKKKDENK